MCLAPFLFFGRASYDVVDKFYNFYQIVKYAPRVLKLLRLQRVCNVHATVVNCIHDLHVCVSV